MQNVVLLSHTYKPARTVACSAKLCYSSSDIPSLYDNLTDEKIASFVEMLSDMGHESPTEHAYFTFGIEGVSRALLAQITRHRIASYSVQSQRYVKNVNFEYVTPPEIENIPEAKAEYERAMKEDIEHYNKLADILKKKHTKFPWVMPFVFRCVLLSIFLEVERKHSHLYKALIRKQRQFIRDYVSNDDSSIISLNVI